MVHTKELLPSEFWSSIQPKEGRKQSSARQEQLGLITASRLQPDRRMSFLRSFLSRPLTTEEGTSTAKRGVRYK
jgi:hypothetical protein